MVHGEEVNEDKSRKTNPKYKKKQKQIHKNKEIKKSTTKLK